MTNIIDITTPITPNMIVYKNKPEKRPVIRATRTLQQGATESQIIIDSHCGTHLDAQSHMIAKGEGLDGVALSKLVDVPCRVIDMSSKERITAADIDQALPKRGEFIILKTKNSLDETFNPNFAYLDATGARSLAKAQITGVGIDALGIEREQPDHETHLALLKSGIVILEGLRLGHVKPGNYLLTALPLSIPGIDGCPCRAVLIQI